MQEYSWALIRITTCRFSLTFNNTFCLHVHIVSVLMQCNAVLKMACLTILLYTIDWVNFVFGSMSPFIGYYFHCSHLSLDDFYSQIWSTWLFKNDWSLFCLLTPKFDHNGSPQTRHKRKVYGVSLVYGKIRGSIRV